MAAGGFLGVFHENTGSELYSCGLLVCSEEGSRRWSVRIEGLVFVVVVVVRSEEGLPGNCGGESCRHGGFEL